ncbi:transcription factor MYB44-like [Oryza sativa Japonica Group]|uniref:Myb-like DNA-binding domain containing protein n=1 Tax=Oryza sativa subsp. japonica TaxID=39947 RepID=Q10MG5_ORYSJ|nr:transcription factor MYB44-like [Oryza sativa Japonica Group]ABF95562.1 Myb-like DNA-binding domain containing protein [Oryza sativa Japonica Group]KAF2938918.1 hypothetical protein DAI22_03g153300 [Oryza sativa Japonica Group]
MDMELSSSSTTVASSPASPPLGRCVVRIRLPPAWTPEEDAVLRLAMENGSRHWRRMAAQMPRRRRSPAQCRDRWRDHLARDVFHRHFTSADDTELARLCLHLDDAGHRWKHVSRAVYGRSSCAVKRRWRELRKSDAFLSALWRPRTTAPQPMRRSRRRVDELWMSARARVVAHLIDDLLFQEWFLLVGH